MQKENLMKTSMNHTACFGMLLFALSGCASGYKSFYTPAPGITPESIAVNRANPAPITPTLERSAPGNPEIILAAYAKRGYTMIGHSMFNSGMTESESAAVKQGKAVGADLVLIFNPQYTGSVTSNIPVTTPTTTTSYTSGSATAYGSGGSVTAYGNATTTTYGTRTTYIPMTVNRSDYGAVYFVKQRFNFGAFARDLNDSERQKLQTNKGAVIVAIVDDTPAFMADVLPGDIISTIDGESVPNQAGYTRMMNDRRGQQIKIMLIRNGESIEKTIQLNR